MVFTIPEINPREMVLDLSIMVSLSEQFDRNERKNVSRNNWLFQELNKSSMYRRLREMSRIRYRECFDPFLVQTHQLPLNHI